MFCNTVIRRLVLSVIIALIPLYSVWAVWEGNAGIAAATEFPSSGLFARSDLFPRNTIIEVLNLEKDITVRVVVVGSSGVSGLIVTLSPEAAQVLNIRPGSISRVRIFIPSLIAERSATARRTTESPSAARDPDINPLLNLTYESGIPLSVTASPAEEPLVPLSQLMDRSQTPAVPAVEPHTESQLNREAAVSTATVVAVPETEPVIMNGSPLSPVAELPLDVPMQDPVLADTFFFPEPELVIPGAEVLPPTAEEETRTEQEIPSKPAEQVFTPTDQVTLVPAEHKPPQLIPSSDPVRDVSPVIQPEPAAPTAIARIQEAPPAGIQPVDPKPEIAPIIELQPLIAPEAKSVIAHEQPAQPVRPDTHPSQPADSLQPPVVLASVLPPSVSAVASDLPFITSFVRNSFYIQLAAYANLTNVRHIVDTWGQQYPVCVERTVGRTGEIYKVFIGPVRRDESGAVLERFKQLGFSDAFIKRVP